MEKIDPLLIEYQAMRQEILQRVMLLHHQLLIASLLYIPLLFGWYWIKSQPLLDQFIDTYILIIPIVYACLTFNYQANQMTLEAVAKYVATELRAKFASSVFNWDDFYGRRKRYFRLTSFLKVTPLYVPFFIPIIIVWQRGTYLSELNQWLIAIDFLFLVLLIINFRYKWRG